MKKNYTEANRKAWNQAIPYHRKVMNKKWDSWFSQPNFIYQKEDELDELNRIGYKDKSIAHLSCNNGIELMSLKRNGAGRCVGFDICDEAIKDAIDRAEKFDIDCEFVRTDVLEIEKQWYDKFDLIYITVGALVWIPDLKLYFKKAVNLLKNGGSIFIYEHHPIGDMFPYDDEKEDFDKVKYPYFSDEIWEETDGIDYYGGEVYDSAKSYEFSYTIADLINYLAQSGMIISSFHEYTKDIALGHQELEKMDKKIPLSFILTAKKR